MRVGRIYFYRKAMFDLDVPRRRNGEECGSAQASRIDFVPKSTSSFGGQSAALQSL
jgi:hypothetical protein